jgi:hypothetical protein
MSSLKMPAKKHGMYVISTCGATALPKIIISSREYYMAQRIGIVSAIKQDSKYGVENQATTQNLMSWYIAMRE